MNEFILSLRFVPMGQFGPIAIWAGTDDAMHGKKDILC